MTLNQIVARQNAKELFAVGKYQIIPKTLKEAMEKMKLSGNEKFDEKLQERIFNEFLAGSKRPALAAYRSGKSNDIDAAMLDASKEWAGLPNPKTGKSYYDGDGRNHANVSLEEVKAGLMADRAMADRAKALAIKNDAVQTAANKPAAQATPSSGAPVVIQTTQTAKQPAPMQVVPGVNGEGLMSSTEQFRH